MSMMSHAPRSPSREPATPGDDFDVELFFDGDCPLCAREISMLRRLDRRDRVRFTDIAAPTFDASTVGSTHEDLMARIHARLPSGELVEGVEVFRRAYAAVGLRPIVALTRAPGIAQLLDVGYRVFAKNRLRWTGRCADGACAIPAGDASAHASR